jgi:hypothetical protein
LLDEADDEEFVPVDDNGVPMRKAEVDFDVHTGVGLSTSGTTVRTNGVGSSEEFITGCCLSISSVSSMLNTGPKRGGGCGGKRSYVVCVGFGSGAGGGGGGGSGLDALSD